jgi:hypothetical protein
MFKTVTEKLTSLLDLLRFAGLSMGDAIYPAFAGFAPTIDPVTDVKGAVVTEVAIRHQHLPNEVGAIGYFE